MSDNQNDQTCGSSTVYPFLQGTLGEAPPTAVIDAVKTMFWNHVKSLKSQITEMIKLEDAWHDMEGKIRSHYSTVKELAVWLDKHAPTATTFGWEKEAGLPEPSKWRKTVLQGKGSDFSCAVEGASEELVNLFADDTGIKVQKSVITIVKTDSGATWWTEVEYE